jgi:MarR family transcriptional regulator for hemolysin
MSCEGKDGAANIEGPALMRYGQNISQKLIAIAQIWRREISRALAETGKSDSLALPLMHLHRRGDRVTQRCLAAWVGVDNSSIVRVLDALELAGEIRREPDSRDRRAKLICLTDQGRITADGIEAILQKIRGRFLAGIAPEDLDVMDRVLGQMLAQHERPASTAADIAAGHNRS